MNPPVPLDPSHREAWRTFIAICEVFESDPDFEMDCEAFAEFHSLFSQLRALGLAFDESFVVKVDAMKRDLIDSAADGDRDDADDALDCDDSDDDEGTFERDGESHATPSDRRAIVAWIRELKRDGVLIDPEDANGDDLRDARPGR